MPRASSRTTPTRRSTSRAIDTQERYGRAAESLAVGLVELPTRPNSIYTMGMRMAAIQEANNGLLLSAADLTLAAITESGYCRGILADLVQGLWGLPRTFAGRADMIADLDDTIERVGQWRELFPDPEIIRLITWGATLGVGPGQMRRRYNARPGDTYPVSPEEAADWKATKAALPFRERPIGAHDNRVLRAWSPKWLRYQWWDDTAFLMTADGEIRITHLDEPAGNREAPPLDDMGRPIPRGNPDEWLLYTPYGSIRPWEFGSWKSATLAFVAERDATFDRLRHSEVLAPTRVGKVPQGTTERQRKLYAQQIELAKRMAVRVLPPGFDYSIIESTGRVADIYKAIIEWAERQYAMQSGSLTTATGTAGFSKGDVQERFTRAILSTLGNTLMTTLHKSALVPWARENYGGDDAPRAELDTAAPEDKKARAETIETAGKALVSLAEGLDRHGYEMSDASVQKYAQSLGFEVDALPVKTISPKIDLPPTAREFAYTLREVRAADGYDPIGDERDEMTIAEAMQLAKKKAQATPEPAAGADAGADVIDDAGPGEPPTDESATALAVAMTHHALERCEHGACNRCRKCGVERERAFHMGTDGVPVWHRAWRPIRAAAYSVNGAAHRPMFGEQAGGEA